MKHYRAMIALGFILSLTALFFWSVPVTHAAPKDTVVTNCTDAGLSAALATGGTITFNCSGPATISVASQKTFALNTTIDGYNAGNGVTLTAPINVRLFWINAGVGLTLTNINIANLNYTPWPGYPIINYGKLVISNSAFVNNAVGIIQNLAGSTLNVTGSTFNGNVGGSGADTIGSAANTTSTIANSTFTHNSGYKVVSTQSALTVTNTLFVSNTAPNIQSQNAALVVIDGGQFISNTGTVIVTNGGQIAVSNSQFLENSNGTSAMMALYGAASFNATDFISNTSGGAIYSTNSLQVSNSKFTGNRSTGYASSIYLYGYGYSPALTLTNSSFISNTASGGAIYNYYGGTAYITNTSFISNTSNNSAGALYLDYPGVVQVLSSTFQSGTGGGIYTNGQSNPLIISDSNFISNTSAFSTAGVSAGTITVTHSNFIGNISSSGTGGLYASRQAYISGSTFINNVGTSAGAMNLTSGGFGPFYDVVANTVVKDNISKANGGGGIRADQHLTLIDSEISGNTAQGNNSGGGLYFWSSYPLTLTRSLFYNNIVTGTNGTGGGIYLTGGSASISNTTIYSNTAGDGGGIYSNGSSLTLTNDTIISNTATTANNTGGNIRNGAMAPVNLRNTIMAGGSQRNCFGSLSSLGHNLSSDASCVIAATGDLTNTNPQLGAFQNNGGLTYSFMPQSSSPAVNAGDNTGCPADDQRGVARPYGMACDIGAIESPHLTPQTITFNSLANKVMGNAPFAITATASSGLPVAFNSQTPTICAVNAVTVTLNSGGTCTIRASQAGNATYAAAPNIDQSFTVQFTQTISFAALPNRLLSQSPFTVSASATSGLPVSFTASGQCNASETNGTTITLTGLGNCTVTAHQAGNASYTSASDVSRTFAINTGLYLPLILR